MRPLSMYVPEPGRGSSIPIDLFTAFALTSQNSESAISLAATEDVPPWALAALVSDIQQWKSQMNFQLCWASRACVFMALDYLIFLKTPSDGVTMKSRVPGIILIRGTVLEIGHGLQANGVHEVSKRSLMAVEVSISFDGFWFL
ncbi:hypothetical protein Tco_0153932 [Tanacetum coccineum]